MKIKYLLIAGIISLIVFLIYLSTLDKKIYYLSLGDSLAVGLTSDNKQYGYSKYLANHLKKEGILETYVNDYSNLGYRTTDLIKDIEDNKKIKINDHTKTLKNALVKADIITLAIGTNDFISKINYTEDYNKLYDYADEMFKDLEKLLKLIRQYCKEDIFLIGYYNPYDINDPKLDEIFKYLNIKGKEISLEYDITYIDIYQTFKNNEQYLPDKYNIHPSDLGYKAIYRLLLKEIDEKSLK